MIRAVLFDFDGTVADTAKTIVETFRSTLSQAGLKEHTEAEIRATIGLPLNTSFMILENQLSLEEANKLCAIYEEIYQETAFKKLEAYDGIREVLKDVRSRGLKAAVVSSKKTRIIEEMVQALDIAEYFDVLLGEDQVENKKPAPDMALKALRLLGDIDPSEGLVLGDSTYDIRMGNTAGCHTVWASYGYGKGDDVLKENPDFIVEDPRGLAGILDRLS